VNELSTAYNHMTENMKHALPQGQISAFFNVNYIQSIPTSKKGT